MKYFILFLPFLLISGLSNATPIVDATIVQMGNEYSAISRIYEKKSHKTGWIKLNDDSIYSPWGRHWAEYTTYLNKGVWEIGLNLSNHGNLGEKGWYKTFKVKSTLTDITQINREILKIKASDIALHQGLSTINIFAAGEYTVRYQWLNDKWGGRYDPEHRDANIKIHSVFFNRIPEPSSLALLSLGAMILLSRRKVLIKHKIPCLNRLV